MRREKVASTDGKSIDVIRFAAEGTPVGTVVHFHGNAQNLTSHLGFSYWLPDEGFHLFVFDYQGYGASDGKPSRAATVADGRVVLQKAIAEAGGKPVFVFGQSLGGTVGYVASALEMPGVCAIVIESSFPSYREIARAKLADFWLTWPLQWPLSFLVSDSYAPRDFTSQLKIPAFFIHGDADNVIPIAEGKKFFAAHQGPKEWVTVKGGGHTAAFGAEQSPYRKMLVDYLREQAKKCEKK